MEASAEHDFVLFGSLEWFAQRTEKDTRADSEAYATYTYSNTLSYYFENFPYGLNNEFTDTYFRVYNSKIQYFFLLLVI